MRSFLYRTLLAFSFVAVSVPAFAQLNLDISTSDPLTKLPADKWIQLVTRIVNTAPIINKDSIYVINATGEEIISVTCRGYSLVGQNPYITNNTTTHAPVSLPAWSVTLIPTETFDTYCKSGVEATGRSGTYSGKPNVANSFRSSTFVTFMLQGSSPVTK